MPVMNQFCVDESISTKTSLQPIPPTGRVPGNFDHECRELAQLLCDAVARRVEEFYRHEKARSAGSGQPAVFPARLLAWKEWAAHRLPGTPGLPDCLDLENPSEELQRSFRPPVTPPAGATAAMRLAAKQTGRTAHAVADMVASLRAFDIDDWHDA